MKKEREKEEFLMKKLLFLLLTLTLVLGLTACHECVFEPATCTAPPTCAECGKTEGEMLPHTMAEANYQAPATCTVCGATEGEKVPAAFEELGYTLGEAGVDYDYVTIGYDNGPNGEWRQQVNTVRMENYRVVESEGELEAKEGYEWRIAELLFTFDDPLVVEDGYRLAWGMAKYYEGDCFIQGEDTVNWNGQEYPVKVVETSDNIGWIDENTAKVVTTSAVQVPVGYDGFVLVAQNPTWHPDISGVMPEMHISSLEGHAPVFFRFD